VAKVFGDEVAKEVQLMMEYDPAPPFNSGSPKTADKKIVERVINDRKEIQDQREQLIKKLFCDS
jgi:cyclohexyl-isocyanide hydratase